MTRLAGDALPRTAHPGHAREDLESTTSDDSSRVIARADGFYWIADNGHQQFGPFATAMEALRASSEGQETGLEPDETLEQAEADIGFVDPKVADEGVAEQ